MLTSPAFSFRKADLDAIARTLEPALRDAFLKAVARMRELVPIGQLTELLEAGELTRILDLAGDLGLDAGARSALRDALLQASIGVAEATAAEFGLAFDIVNPYAVRWASQHAAETIQGISAETSQAVRDIIGRAIIEGNAPRVAARDIRRVVGLTQRDALAVDRFSQGMGQAPNARSMADRMADRLLRRRAENIARTETMLAANRGQQAAWDAAADQGLIDRGARKVWIATGDRRTCPICRVLDGQTVGFADNFAITEQATGFTDSGEIAGTRALARPSSERTPPAHASCRCTTGLVFDEGVPRPPPAAVHSWTEAVERSQSWQPEDERIITDWTNGSAYSSIRRAQIEGQVGTVGARRAERFAQALQDAPRFEGRAYRGMLLTKKQAETLLNSLDQPGAEYAMEAFSSFSTHRGVAEGFANSMNGNARGSVGIIFNTETTTSRALGRFARGDENEVIISGGARFRVTGVNWEPRKVKRGRLGYHWVFDVFMEEI